ncbi:hypothetical protein [Ralstonia syzygii]|uniref:hypothetical protein n=1 Tax=Ralstonia syzygii TaxID=28097 RepID=UPI003519B6EC
MRKTIGVLLLAALGGCASSYQQARIAVLQHPETKQTVECRVDPWGSNYRKQVDNCVAAYQKAGYKLVADSADAPQ